MALQWTPLRLIMTGDNGLDRRRSEHIIYNDYRYRGGVRMLDKEVQYNPAEFMDYEGADSGLGGSGDLATVTVVEINNSPTAIYGDHALPLSNPAFSYNSGSDNNNSNNINNNNSSVLSESNVNEHGHNNSIIRRDSIEKLHELQENNEGDCLPDTTDYSTLPAAYRIGSLLDNSKVDNDIVDEIKEQSSLVVLNNTAINDEKLKELSEKSDDSSCALDCLSFTIQCCDCTIL